VVVSYRSALGAGRELLAVTAENRECYELRFRRSRMNGRRSADVEARLCEGKLGGETQEATNEPQVIGERPVGQSIIITAIHIVVTMLR
jgi:hypothetical protein